MGRHSIVEENIFVSILGGGGNGVQRLCLSFVFLKKSFFGTMVYRAVVCTLEKRSPGVLPCWWLSSKIRKLDGGRGFKIKNDYFHKI